MSSVTDVAGYPGGNAGSPQQSTDTRAQVEFAATGRQRQAKDALATPLCLAGDQDAHPTPAGGPCTIALICDLLPCVNELQQEFRVLIDFLCVFHACLWLLSLRM